MRALLPLSLLLLLGCPTDTDTGSDKVTFAGPEMTHTPPASVVEATALTVDVTAVDDDGIGGLQVFYRKSGGAWEPAAMELEGDTYSATIPAESIAYPAVEYYFKGADLGDPSATSYLPRESTSAPFRVPVSVVGEDFPFSEDFELAEGDPESLTLLGWNNASQAFRGYPWAISDRAARSGLWSATHPRGVESAGVLQDWLVSPAINLGPAATAQVTWWEYGITPGASVHGLYISVGSPDPEDGEYVAVEAALPAAPDEEWARSSVYDLSAWVGQVVYLAWYFEGEQADDWFIDDVVVEELRADLDPTFTQLTTPLHPGETGSLQVEVANTSSVDASGVSVSISFPEGGASLDRDTLEIASIVAGSSALETVSVTVAPESIDNQYLPVLITVTEGENVVSEEAQLLVGYASTVDVDWDGDDVGSLLLTVGVGDPDSPDWSTTLYSGEAPAGTSRYSLDITEAVAYLPPAAGELRWWVQADSEAGGSVDTFVIEAGGAAFESTDVPATVLASSSGTAYLPEAPSLTLLSNTTTPSELDPGTLGASLTLRLRNDGADTSGSVTATLVSADPDVTILDGGPLEIDADVLERSEVITLSNVFSFDVADTHVDSTDVALELILDDGVEQWSFPLSYAVPYPVLRITGVTIDDDGGDGILDPDEYAELTFRVTNQGDEATSGLVRGVLGVAATSVVSAEVGADSENVGSLSEGDTELVDDFTVQVNGGAEGEVLDLELLLTDSTRSYLASLPLTLGEPPWQPLSDLGDATGDQLNGSDFDIANGSYRVLDETLQLRLTSNVAFDPSLLFVESWGASPGGAYDLYIIVAQSGVGTLRGYSFSAGSFIDVGELTVTYPDAYTVQIDAPLSLLELTFDEFSLGFGVGWCGGDEAYCDHYPDGWGYPYTGYNTSEWFELTW